MQQQIWWCQILGDKVSGTHYGGTLDGTNSMYNCHSNDCHRSSKSRTMRTGSNCCTNTGANTCSNTGSNTCANIGANTCSNTGSNTCANTGANTCSNTDYHDGIGWLVQIWQ